MSDFPKPGEPFVVMKRLNPDIEAGMSGNPESSILKEGARIFRAKHSVVKVTDTLLSLTPKIANKSALQPV